MHRIISLINQDGNEQSTSSVEQTGLWQFSQPGAAGEQQPSWGLFKKGMQT